MPAQHNEAIIIEGGLPVLWCHRSSSLLFWGGGGYYQGRELLGLKFGPIFDELNVNLLTGTPFSRFQRTGLIPYSSKSRSPVLIEAARCVPVRRLAGFPERNIQSSLPSSYP